MEKLKMIKVLHKALDILEFVSYDKNRTYSLTEIAQEIDEKPTTCANIIKTLLDQNMWNVLESEVISWVLWHLVS